MIATISHPGGKNFQWKHVKNDAEARAWRAAWLRDVGESQETLGAVRDGLLLTDAEARRGRYRSGEKIYVADGILLAEGPC